MSFFAKLAHQISANTGDVPPQGFSASITRARDVDEFVGGLRGYHLELMQIDKGSFVGEAVQIQLAPMLLSAAQYSRALFHSGEPPSQKITFAIATCRVPGLWQGKTLGHQDLLVATAGIEIDLVSQAGFGVATLSFPLELARETADALGWILPTGTSTSLVLRLDHNSADKLRSALGKAFAQAVAGPLVEQASAWSTITQEDILRILLRCITAPALKSTLVSNGERARVLKAALSAINDQPEDVLTVGDLCRIAKASERTLHYAFTERFGLAPAHYMKARRLNGARNDLCHQNDGLMKIADVANKWGFWHLGQFAKDYRTWFRELPSETYERKHRPKLRPAE